METETLPKPRSLKKSEIRSLLVAQMKQEQPDFRLVTFATGVYYFQRVRDFADYDLKEMLHVVYSFTEHRIQASVSSRLNPVHAFSPIYNNGLINPHVGLNTLRNASNEIAATEVYHCDGSIEGARETIGVVIGDFKTVGLQYLDDRWRDLSASKLIKAGINIIDEWDLDKTMLGNEMQAQLRKAKFSVERIRHPLLNKLKLQLMSIPAQTDDMKQQIPRLAFDLMELYCNRRIAAY